LKYTKQKLSEFSRAYKEMKGGGATVRCREYSR
jgi:hypothetical protein